MTGKAPHPVSMLQLEPFRGNAGGSLCFQSAAERPIRYVTGAVHNSLREPRLHNCDCRPGESHDSEGGRLFGPRKRRRSNGLFWISPLFIWTSDNPGGSPVHYGVVQYGADPKSLSETVRSPVRVNPALALS